MCLVDLIFVPDAFLPKQVRILMHVPQIKVKTFRQ